ncbi:hypothetical protein SAMN02745126_06470 [Enhydrobacter aerosaccus]|uniref:DUF2239 domain-containing protein n=1 Tax=Enhydrobacter aerosaccus TaxID=225324 RepID=A0A1T4TL36_9HYPH|nr:DUF2239 family protein [Enhydrobacter aerosaccus]SKA41094.1 hypothetical protein SAMN02745126_06470 [Enhydrobacter aerosaccus]
MMPPSSLTAFRTVHVLATGAPGDVALAVKAAQEADPAAAILVFDDTTGAVIDLDLRGTAAEVAARFARAPASGETEGETLARRRGRPKLGVIAREVTLLPRHWEWLARQPGGASQALRRLVDEARRSDGDRTRLRAAREAAYRFMSAMAGNLSGFEEASRALFSEDRNRFAQHIRSWPADIRAYAHRLMQGDAETITPDKQADRRSTG